jgi:two-component system, NtrC family, response regulator HydG
MQPALIAVAGPLNGERFLLDEDLTSVGRVSENRIAINDLSVSRRHCVIARQGEAYLLRDLDSHNGTFVNGVPVEERYLEEGDRIDVGDCSFLFRLDGGRISEHRTPVVMDEGRSGLLTRFELKTPWALELAALLKVTTTVVLLENIYRSRGAPAQAVLEQQLFSLIFEIVPCDSGVVFLADEDEGQQVLCSGQRQEGSGPLPVKSDLLDEALDKGEPVAGSDDGGAALAVPMSLGGRVVGALYLASANPARKFLEREVQVLTPLANICGLALHHARELEFLEAENRQLRSSGIEHSMIGESERMRRLLQMISRVAQGNSTVLIRGESGTGKELVARAIHRNSARAGNAFVAINCAAVTDTLLESEFFGHEKGSFTGAVGLKKGKLETADGGTVFLDEIGELAPGLQAKLLRVLQEHEFERVGGNKTIKVDIRIITATNRDLEAAIKAGVFRQDLYYRLNVLTLETPSLRDRREDILPLAAWFAQRFAKLTGRHVRGLSERTRACLLAYDWPGNVRELENAIERAVVLGSTDMILAEDLPDAVVESEPVRAVSGSFHDTVRETKKQLIVNALEKAGGNFTEAAKLLDLHPNYLHRLATQLHLRHK